MSDCLYSISILVQESPLGSYSIAPRFFRGSSGFLRGRPRFRGKPDSGLPTGNWADTGNGPASDLEIIDGDSGLAVKLISPGKLAVDMAGLIGSWAGLILIGLDANFSLPDWLSCSWMLLLKRWP